MWSKHKLLTGSLGTAVVAISVAGTVLFYKINAPARGVIDESSAGNAQVKKIDMTPRLATGKNAAFQYPSGLQVKPANPMVQPELEQFNFAYHDIQSWILSISISTLSSGRLADISSLQFRRTKPDTYKESVVNLGDRDITVMTDVTVPGFGKVGYFVDGNRSATVSLIGDDPLGVSDLDKTFTMVLSTWHWQ